MSNSFYFIEKKALKRKSRDITAKVEKMFEAFYEFLDLLSNLEKESYIDFQNLGARAGIDVKLLTEVTKAVNIYRDIYFKKLSEIFQTSIDDFSKEAGAND